MYYYCITTCRFVFLVSKKKTFQTQCFLAKKYLPRWLLYNISKIIFYLLYYLFQLYLFRPHKIKWSWQLKNGSEIVVDERSKIMNISEVTMKLNDSIVSCCVDSMKMGTCNLPKNKFLIRVRGL